MQLSHLEKDNLAESNQLLEEGYQKLESALSSKQLSQSDF